MRVMAGAWKEGLNIPRFVVVMVLLVLVVVPVLLLVLVLVVMRPRWW